MISNFGKNMFLSVAAVGICGLATVNAHGQERTFFDFHAEAPNASWTNGSRQLPFGGSGSDGFAVFMKNVHGYTSVLHTHPAWKRGGMIVGRYSNITMPRSTTVLFKTKIGFLKGAHESDGVTFEVECSFPGYNGIPVSLQYYQPYSEHIESWTVDLSRFRGLTGSISLIVNAGPNSSAQDWAVWATPELLSSSDSKRTPFFIGGAVGNGRRGNKLMGAWGGKSGLVTGDKTLYLEFDYMTRDYVNRMGGMQYSLNVDSYHNGRFVKRTNKVVEPGTTGVWLNVPRNQRGAWKEKIYLWQHYAGEINYFVDTIGD